MLQSRTSVLDLDIMRVIRDVSLSPTKFGGAQTELCSQASVEQSVFLHASTRSQ